VARAKYISYDPWMKSEPKRGSVGFKTNRFQNLSGALRLVSNPTLGRFGSDFSFK